MSPKAKKILDIVVDVVCAIVLVFAVILTISAVRSKAKGYNDYTEVFGSAYVAVATDSMNAPKPATVPEGKPSGFARGDLISVKILDESGASSLEVGDVITFKTREIVKDKWVLNTHRITKVNEEGGKVVSFTTHGDANPDGMTETVALAEVIGVYKGKAPGIGHVFLFMSSSAGFFVCIVLPTLLVVVYCVINLILVIRKEKKSQTAEAEVQAAAEKEALLEEARKQVLAEMEAQKNAQTAEEPTETDNKQQ